MYKLQIEIKNKYSRIIFENIIYQLIVCAIDFNRINLAINYNTLYIIRERKRKKEKERENEY